MSITLITPLAEPVESAGRTRQKRALLVDTAIVCSIAAAFAHLVAAPDHFLWWPASGLFFVALGVAQLLAAVALVFGVAGRGFVLTTIWGTVGVIGLYIASRTIGLPNTPPVPFHGGRWVVGRSIVPDGAKYVGPLDVFALTAEVVLVATLLPMLSSRAKRRATNQLMWIGLALSAAGLAALAS